MAKAEDYPNSKVAGLTGDKRTLGVALERFNQCLNATDIIRAEALEDVLFVNGKQWLESLLKDRADDRRPALTINRLPTFLHQVTNDMRQNRPAIKIRATDNQWTDNAEVIDGLIRSIMHNGNSKAAVDTAADYQTMCGMGYMRVATQYKDEESFDQEILIKRVDNPFAVYFPVHLCQEMDWSDAPYCFVRSKMSKEEFKDMFPNASTSSFEKQGAGDPNWMGEDYIYVAEYFEVEKDYEKLYLLEDGSIINDKKDVGDQKIVKERDVEKRTITWRLMSEFDILDEKEWPSKYLPIVPVLGQEINENGKKTYVSLIRNVKDSQRAYNFFYSAFSEQVALSPKAPYVVAEGQVDAFKAIWQTANLKNHAYLPYTPVSLEGQPVPPPQRTMPPEVGSAIIEGINMAVDNLKATTGIFDASLGSRGNETSGKAIIARQKEGDNSNFHFTDNLAKSMTLVGKILIDLIPTIYDTPRTIRILGPDMADEVIEINQQNPNKDGKLYDLTVGCYEVIVDIGPSYETKRTETAQNLINVTQAMPQVGQAIGDMLLRLLDFPEADEAADRIKRLIQTTMPGIIQDEEQPGGEMSPAEVQQVVADLQKLMQAHQMTMQENQQMQQLIGQLQAQLKDKSEERQVKADTAVIRANAEVQKAQIQQGGEAMRHNITTQLELEKLARMQNLSSLKQR